MQVFAQLGNGLFNFFKSFSTQSAKPLKEKKWVRPELIEGSNLEVDLSDSNKVSNQKLTENEESS